MSSTEDRTYGKHERTKAVQDVMDDARATSVRHYNSGDWRKDLVAEVQMLALLDIADSLREALEHIFQQEAQR